MSQLIKLGLMSPETPHNLLSIAQQMWANNGDIISRQYAGTNALKVGITLSKHTRNVIRKFPSTISVFFSHFSIYSIFISFGGKMRLLFFEISFEEEKKALMSPD